jgi:putative membrane protein
VRGLIVTVAVNVVALWVAARLLDGVDYHGDLGTLILAGLVLGLVNLFVRPVVRLLALPLVILTLGLALLLVNALMLGLTSALVPGFAVHGVGAAILGALVISAVNLALSVLLKRLAR